MTRFIVTDTTTGEIVLETSRHPGLAPLRHRPRKSSYNYRRKTTRPHIVLGEAIYIGLLLGVLAGTVCWYYAIGY